MARTVLIAGTASHVGKSTVAAGLCRLLARRGAAVAPFKAQNMSNNARAVVTPDGTWGEIGVSQYVQARAADAAPVTDMNPVLLKPRGGGESQLVIHGEAVGHVGAGSYYDDRWAEARRAAVESYERLSRRYDVIVAEGAGSIAEINLRDRDLANVETGRFADASILLLADIERGGAFASLYGTLELMPNDLRDRVEGALVTKFRGDETLLRPGLRELERRTGVPVLGVLPYDDPGLPAEDSVSLPAADEAAVAGADDGVSDDAAVTVAVPRFPHLSNATDLEPLAREPGVRVAYVPLTGDLADADAVVLPGTKNTVDDLLALRESGFDASLARFDGPIVGICGGYQMLGERIANADVEGTTDREVVDGLGLLPVETRFSATKTVAQVTRELIGCGPLTRARGRVSGYEIHAGHSTPAEGVARPVGPWSAATETVLGTYLHGLFDDRSARTAFVEAAFRAADKPRVERHIERPDPYDRAADLVAEAVDVEALLGPLLDSAPS